MTKPIDRVASTKTNSFSDTPAARAALEAWDRLGAERYRSMLDSHPNSTEYRSVMGTLMFQGGMEAGRLGFHTQSDDDGEGATTFSLVWMAKLYGKDVTIT